MAYGEDGVVCFSEESLARFVASEGRKVEKIICHLWQNLTNKNDTFEIIDNVELHFGDGDKLTIACNGESAGLEAIVYDYTQAARAIHAEFGDNIKLFSIDASGTTLWNEVTGKILKAIRLTKYKSSYRADALVLDFGDELREISVSPTDGLIIDRYED